MIDEIARQPVPHQTDNRWSKSRGQVPVSPAILCRGQPVCRWKRKPDDEGTISTLRVYGKDVREGVWYATSPNYRGINQYPDTTTLESYMEQEPWDTFARIDCRR